MTLSNKAIERALGERQVCGNRGSKHEITTAGGSKSLPLTFLLSEWLYFWALPPVCPTRQIFYYHSELSCLSGNTIFYPWWHLWVDLFLSQVLHAPVPAAALIALCCLMPGSDLFSSLNLMTSFVFRFFKMWSDHLLPSNSHTSTTVHVAPVLTSSSGSSVIPSSNYLLAC